MSGPLTPDGGVIRLFPLPNLVFFPGAMQPLHIFEPRYRQMTADALAGDRLLALVLPRADGVTLHPVACVGRIVAEQQLPDGRFNLLLRGLKRIRIRAEVATAKLYRSARVEMLEDVACTEADRRARLREVAPRWFADQAEVRDRFVELLDGEMPLGALADVMAFALPLEAEFKQMLLEELDVGRRLDRLLERLGQRRSFPPEFSAN